MRRAVALIGLQACLTVSLLTAQQQQTITFKKIPAQVVGQSLTLSASASSSLPVSFSSSTPAVCTVSGTTATLVAAGTCTIQASQAGNTQFAAAAPVLQTFAIAAAAAKTKSGSSGSSATQYSSIASGGKLPYGKSVTLTGQTSDIKCGSQAISDVIDISGISVSYLGQTSTPSAGTITGNTWTAPLGSLPADATIDLQLKVTGKLSDATATDVTNELLADPRFLTAVNGFFAATNAAANDQSSPKVITSAMATQEAQMVLDNISGKNGALTQILGRLLPSPCSVATDVTAAAMMGLRTNETALLNFQTRAGDLRKPGVHVPGLDPNASAADAYKLVKTLKIDPDDKATNAVVRLYMRDYEAILGAFKVDVVAQLSQGVQLTQVTDTADLNKYAGFDVGAMYAPRINELRQFDMVHIYPFGPVELDTSGGVPFKGRWSIALGASVGDLSSNGKSRVKGDKAFVYGVGFRINKYFRISAGGMLYRDAIGNGLLNELFIGPSIDVTALPGLKQMFSSSSGTSGGASSKSGAAGNSGASNSSKPTGAANPADNSTNQ